ncbi:MAG: crotonase/enoyl-CoA hydratase family protein, partial [Kiloniellaceae bacterium]
HVAVLWGEGGAFCAGWDLKFVSSLSPEILDRELSFPDRDPDDPNAVPRGPLGPTRLELSKPVIAAVAGPAVAGGMELALWCDIRVMEEDAYFGVYCRRWGVPLIDGGTVRLPRLVGQGRALEIILTGRKVPAEEALRIGACEEVVPAGESRAAAERIAQQIARFPQVCVRADRRSAIAQHGLSVREAMKAEWRGGRAPMRHEAVEGAARFARGLGRHGDFGEI